MDLIVSPSIFESYFNGFLKSPKEEYDNDISALINNPNNRFIVSKDFITYLEKKFDGSPLSTIFLPFLVNLINAQALKVPSSGASDGNKIVSAIADEYNGLKANQKKDISLVIGEKPVANHEFIIDLTQINSKNKHWILFKTSCHHPAPTVLRFYDFKNDNEIHDTIEGFFCFRKPNIGFTILDRQANFDHKLFDFFKKDSTTVYYYTTHNTLSDNKSEFKTNFKSCRVHCKAPKYIHERKVLNGDFILEIDNDFWNVTFKDDTWTILLSYSPQLSREIGKKIKSFVRLL
jgi:hypothetical protein